MEAKEMLGKKYGRLLVTGFESVRIKGTNRTHNRVYLFCKCECGADVRARKDSVLSGQIVSCGCNRIEKAHYSGLKHAESCKTHGMTNTRIFRIWVGMRKRCSYQKGKDYKHYGERGITVCKEWESNFIAFKEWAFANGYSDNLTIDRINVDGNYEPSNCRWITMAEQQKNKRRHIIRQVARMGEK